MKKLLMLFTTINLVVSSSATIVSCNLQEGKAIPLNPSNKEELLVLLNQNYRLVEYYNDSTSKLEHSNASQAYYKFDLVGNFSVLTDFEKTELKENTDFQLLLVYYLKILSTKIKVKQYLDTVDEKGQAEFYDEFSEVLAQWKLTSNDFVYKTNHFRNFLKWKIINSGAASDTTIASGNEILEWLVDNRFEVQTEEE